MGCNRRASGGGAYIGIGLESQWGTAVAPTTFIEFRGEDMRRMYKKIQREAIINSRGTQGLVNDVVDVSGGITGIEVNPDNIPLLIACALGHEDSVAGGDPYTHVFKPASNDECLPSLSIQKGIDIRHIRYSGMVVDSFKLSAQMHQILLADFTFIGKDGDDTVGGVAAEVSTVTCVADVSGSLNNKYFFISSPDVHYYVWFNVNSGGTDPEIADRTGVEVAIATDAANTAVASALESALDALSAFGAAAVSEVVTVTNATAGECENPTDAGSTGFTLAVTVAGTDTATSYSSLVPLTFSQGALSLDPTNSGTLSAVYYAKGIELEYKNNNDPDGYSLDGSSTRSRVDKGQVELTGKLMFYLTDTAYNDIITAVEANTDVELKLLFTSPDTVSGSNYTLQIDIDHMHLGGETPPVVSDGRGFIPYEVDFTAFVSGSDPQCIFTMINGTATKYIP